MHYQITCHFFYLSSENKYVQDVMSFKTFCTPAERERNTLLNNMSFSFHSQCVRKSSPTFIVSFGQSRLKVQRERERMNGRSRVMGDVWNIKIQKIQQCLCYENLRRKQKIRERKIEEQVSQFRVLGTLKEWLELEIKDRKESNLLVQNQQLILQPIIVQLLSVWRKFGSCFVFLIVTMGFNRVGSRSNIQNPIF